MTEAERLRSEVARLNAALKRANEQAEHFEREWYLRGDELEALKKAISEAQPVAWIVEGQTLGGNVAQYLAWNKSGAGQVPAPLQTEPEPLYTLKGIK